MKTTTGFHMTTVNKRGQITQAMFVEFLGKVVIQLHVTGIAYTVVFILFYRHGFYKYCDSLILP